MRKRFSLFSLTLGAPLIVALIWFVWPYQAKLSFGLAATDIASKSDGFTTYRGTLTNKSAGRIYYKTQSQRSPMWTLEYSHGGGRVSQPGYMVEVDGKVNFQAESLGPGESVDFFMDAPEGSRHLVAYIEAKARWDWKYKVFQSPKF